MAQIKKPFRENVYNRSRTVGTTFVASAEVDPAVATKTLEILSVDGGGGGTSNGGAGAGGLVYHPGLPVTFTSITVTVGGVVYAAIPPFQLQEPMVAIQFLLIQILQ